MANVDRDYCSLASNVGKKVFVDTVLHPIDYCKTLMQIGFEPLPAKPSTTIFGKPVQVYPNVFVYANYIRSVSGTIGLFNGLTPRLSRSIISVVSQNYIKDKIPIPDDDDGDSEKEKHTRFVLRLGRDIFATSTSIIFSQPFHVITVRMMAQFVGRETKYNGVVSSLVTIYKEEGVGGWFAGLVPRLFGEVAALFCVASVKYVVNNYLVTGDKSFQQVLSFGLEYFVRNLFYPFHVVDVCMAVNDCGLRAGSSPFMPSYSGNWMCCWDDLVITNQKKRGTSMFWRYAPSPEYGLTKSIPLPLLELPKMK